MSAFLTDLWEIGKTAGGIVFGAAISWFATRYSDAIRERRARIQEDVCIVADINLLMETISHNLECLHSLHEEAEKLRSALVACHIKLPFIRQTLNYSPLSELISRCISSGAPQIAVRHALTVAQNLESLDVQLERLSQRMGDVDKSPLHKDIQFSHMLDLLIADANPEGLFCGSIRHSYLSLKELQNARISALDQFYKKHPLSSYIFKTK